MKILAEIHFGIPLGVACIFLGLYLYWLQNHAYPSFLEKQIKKGKPWLYMPLSWNSKKKAYINFTSQIFYTLTICSILFGLLVSPIEHWKSFIITAISALILLVLGKWKIRKRFQQQVNSYFSFVDAVTAEFEREGKGFSEQELHNLASYQFQNAMRSADSNSRLLKELDERS